MAAEVPRREVQHQAGLSTTPISRRLGEQLLVTHTRGSVEVGYAIPPCRRGRRTLLSTTILALLLLAACSGGDAALSGAGVSTKTPPRVDESRQTPDERVQIPEVSKKQVVASDTNGDISWTLRAFSRSPDSLCAEILLVPATATASAPRGGTATFCGDPASFGRTIGDWHPQYRDIVGFAPKSAAAVRLVFDDGATQHFPVVGRDSSFPAAFYVAFVGKGRVLSNYVWLDDSGQPL